ncbi:MAG: branched-chain amino acid ABC transporter permease [Deltaproteobacteria bacterium]|nr:branched-chain amino acid ABC transporter permease [Deltaproteobacteria bacterium]
MKKKMLFLAGGVVLFLLAPLAFRPSQLMMLNEIMIFALYAMSYNLLLGYGGLLSFGHSVFLGFGAYITGVLLVHYPEFPFLALILISTLGTLLVGFTLGLLLLRQTGASFALLTMAIGGMFSTIALKWSDVTGGDDGICIFRPDINLFLLQLNTTDVTVFYYISMFLIGLATLCCWHFTRTSMGQTVLLIRENENRMQFLGYSAPISRLMLFTVSASLAGLAGSLYMLFIGTVAYDVISIPMSATALLITFIGGIGSFFGPWLGAAFYIYVQDLLSGITTRWPFFMGIIFILMVMFQRQGLAGLLVRCLEGFRWLKDRRCQAKDDPAQKEAQYELQVS